jgi:hypothetical protein
MFRKIALASLVQFSVGIGLAAMPAGAISVSLNSDRTVQVSPAAGYFPSWYAYPITGSPFLPGAWYAVKPCLPGVGGIPANTTFCVAPPTPNPAAPITFPGNFPDEFFYWHAAVDFRAGNVRARLILATEGAFAGGTDLVNGQQATFNRIRIRVSGLKANTFYKVTHPYGVGLSANGQPGLLQADGSGAINVTHDYGCGAVMAPACNFAALTTAPTPPLGNRIQQILAWNTLGNGVPYNAANPANTAPPTGFLGDAVTPHKVIGSPYGTNYFRVEEVRANGSLVAPPVVNTDLFTVAGAIAP